ncbi:hypothetical protein Noc_0788 [Nitrosococcus oceani ATCC 19707]|uniref:Uncharacterized protein n=2 Tax=Nitrosococcus oceani TaxID=1229 RepID=Q3JCZ5_NITOC|nr:hypothetical protein [Nitrosococcus oceani]ABA57301.1 hypothetical protein Noc_0788 [Nitrosococcus oceani ATCC 19707]KFI20277.1 hypothetical protein IB75_03975 [Nitrosococcus oceani C-27]GEM20175.1 hypothetical protein NONS58_15850 [Nitrosococcus oceani]
MTSQHGVIKDVSRLSATISITDCSGRLDGKFREINGSYFTAQGIKKSGKTGTQQGSDIESRQVLPLMKDYRIGNADGQVVSGATGVVGVGTIVPFSGNSSSGHMVSLEQAR